MNTSTDKVLMTDEVIAEVRRHKNDIAARFGYDVLALGRSLQQREALDPRFPKRPHTKHTASPS